MYQNMITRTLGHWSSHLLVYFMSNALGWQPEQMSQTDSNMKTVAASPELYGRILRWVLF